MAPRVFNPTAAERSRLRRFLSNPERAAELARANRRTEREILDLISERGTTAATERLREVRRERLAKGRARRKYSASQVVGHLLQVLESVDAKYNVKTVRTGVSHMSAEDRKRAVVMNYTQYAMMASQEARRLKGDTNWRSIYRWFYH